MKIDTLDLSHIPVTEIRRESPWSFNARVNPVQLDLDKELVLFDKNIDIEGSVVSQDDEMIVEANVHGRCRAACSRCLEKYEEECDQDMEFALEETPEKFVNLMKHFREEMILNFPMNFLCKEDCKGLCPQCGCNLNLESCSCLKDQG